MKKIDNGASHRSPIKTWLSGLVALSIGLSQLQAHAVVSKTTPASISASASPLPLVVFLYLGGTPMNCSSWLRYTENHTFDMYTGETVGYIDGFDIVDEEGEVIGFLGLPVIDPQHR
jgi:hypothetical protein